MPELPEVEARRRTIEHACAGSVLVSLAIEKKGIVKHEDPGIRRRMTGETLLSVDRRGKYIVLGFPDKLQVTLHFGLFGEMAVAGSGETFPSVCARFDFDNKRTLFLLRWASVWFGKGVESLEKLGPDPIAEPAKFTRDYLIGALSKKKTKIKQCLMDQAVIAGIGAVYADEILFHAHILPDRPANTLNDDESKRLYDVIRTTLKSAIEKTESRGDESRPFLSLEGKENCPVCGTQIVNTRLAGRRTLSCPHCQH